jgi:hypothetical protein
MSKDKHLKKPTARGEAIREAMGQRFGDATGTRLQ